MRCTKKYVGLLAGQGMIRCGEAIGKATNECREAERACGTAVARQLTQAGSFWFARLASFECRCICSSISHSYPKKFHSVIWFFREGKVAITQGKVRVTGISSEMWGCRSSFFHRQLTIAFVGAEQFEPNLVYGIKFYAANF